MGALPCLLAPERRTRLVRLLGMCGSAHDGERANAAALAAKLIRESNLTWDDVIGGQDPSPAYEPPRPDYEGPRSASEDINWRQMAAAVINCGRGSGWEITFCREILWRGSNLSPKQQAVLHRVYRERVVRGRRSY